MEVDVCGSPNSFTSEEVKTVEQGWRRRKNLGERIEQILQMDPVIWWHNEPEKP